MKLTNTVAKTLGLFKASWCLGSTIEVAGPAIAALHALTRPN